MTEKPFAATLGAAPADREAEVRRSSGEGEGPSRVSAGRTAGERDAPPPLHPPAPRSEPSHRPSLSLRRRLLDWRQRLEYRALRLVAGLFARLGVDRAAALSGGVWRWAAPLVARRRHRRAFDNLAIAFPELSPPEARRLVAAHWDNLGRVLAEAVLIERLIAEPERFEVLGAEHLRGPDGRFGPLVAVSLHMGNWELAMMPLLLAGAAPAAVYRRVDNPYVEAMVRGQREQLYTGGLWGRGRGVDASGEERSRDTAATRMARHLREGGVLGLVADLYDRSGPSVPFFGRPAPSFKGPAQLARTAKARVVAGRCLRIGTTSRFRIEIVPVPYRTTGDAKADITQLTADLQACFEVWVRDAPEQWMWSNRRWS
jgi:KDO2-lipid IV(A) lauroyltransferase